MISTEFFAIIPDIILLHFHKHFDIKNRKSCIDIVSFLSQALKAKYKPNFCKTNVKDKKKSFFSVSFVDKSFFSFCRVIDFTDRQGFSKNHSHTTLMSQLKPWFCRKRVLVYFSGLTTRTMCEMRTLGAEGTCPTCPNWPD